MRGCSQGRTHRQHWQQTMSTGEEHKLITQHHGITEPDLLDVIALPVPPMQHG